jgi:hypothetical protein
MAKRKMAGRKSALKMSGKMAGKKTGKKAAKKTPTPASTAARKAAGSRKAGAKKAAAKKTGTKKAAARKAAPKKAAPRKAPSRKAASRKAAPRRVASKKAAPKRAAAKKATTRKPPARRATATLKKPARAAAPIAKSAPKKAAKAAGPARAGNTAPIRGAIPSSLGMNRGSSSSARTGREELLQHIKEHNETSPAITAGDVDADWQLAYSSGDEAPGGDNPTPDQDVVDEIGEALGVNYEDGEELKGAAKIEDRDKHRWELDPASKDDFEDA